MTTQYYTAECSTEDFRLEGLRKLLVPRIQNRKVLELGLGTGHFTNALSRKGFQITSVDIDHDLIEKTRARNPSVQFVKADANYPAELPDQRFPSIIAVDFLEHVEKDEQLLSALAQRQQPGDQLLVLVPLYPRLYSAHDKAIGHMRRYVPRELTDKITRAGYRINWQRKWNAPGLIACSIKPGAGTRMVNGKLVIDQSLKVGPIAQGLRWWLSTIESRLPLGFGLSLTVDAERR